MKLAFINGMMTGTLVALFLRNMVSKLYMTLRLALMPM
jgi:hypothetical protein